MQCRPFRVALFLIQSSQNDSGHLSLHIRNIRCAAGIALSVGANGSIGSVDGTAMLQEPPEGIALLPAPSMHANGMMARR